MPLTKDARIDIERFWSTIECSGEIGPGRPGGLSRLTLSDTDKQMRDQFVGWCKQANLSVCIDGIGNIFARRNGIDDSLPPIVS